MSLAVRSSKSNSVVCPEREQGGFNGSKKIYSIVYSIEYEMDGAMVEMKG